MAQGPLDGVRVLEFSQIIAGPFCGMLLADMGADVIKFEPIEGEPWRTLAEVIPKESRAFASLNRGKRGIAIDLARPEAKEAVARLVPSADVVIINYRPGVAGRLGIDYETLSAINPRIVYCENTAFGRHGPLASLAGYDIVVQAMTGLMAGEAKMQGETPTWIYPAIGDFATGIQMSNAICAALFAREKTGKGQRIDSTLMGTAMAIQTSAFLWIDALDGETLPAMLDAIAHARAEKRPFREQAAARLRFRPVAAGNIYYRVYQTADGFIALGALSLPLRQRVLEATGLHDPRFRPDGSFELAPEGWEEAGPKLLEEAEALFLSMPTDHWLDVLGSRGVPIGPLHFIEELFQHPQSLANGLVAEVDHPLLGHMKMVGPPFQMSETPLAVQGASPVLGADTDEVLREAGYGEGEIDALRSAGVIGRSD